MHSPFPMHSHFLPLPFFSFYFPSRPSPFISLPFHSSRSHLSPNLLFILSFFSLPFLILSTPPLHLYNPLPSKSSKLPSIPILDSFFPIQSLYLRLFTFLLPLLLPLHLTLTSFPCLTSLLPLPVLLLYAIPYLYLLRLTCYTIFFPPIPPPSPPIPPPSPPCVMVLYLKYKICG